MFHTGATGTDSRLRHVAGRFGSSRPQHPVLHGKPFAPGGLGTDDLLLGGIPQWTQEGDDLVVAYVVSRLDPEPAVALGREQVVAALLLVQPAYARGPVVTKEAVQHSRVVAAGGDEAADVGQDGDASRRLGARGRVMGQLACGARRGPHHPRVWDSWGGAGGS